uniref:Uncharacterized protein n=1 Tax=Octopus bimaculoides TaxID=37653 RepID=A0A0L8IFH6_OCTBM
MYVCIVYLLEADYTNNENTSHVQSELKTFRHGIITETCIHIQSVYICISMYV